MNKIKSLYEAPTIDILEVQFEGALLQASNYGSSQAAGRGFSSSDENIYDYTDYDF